MKLILSDKLPRILKNKKRLEEALSIKITNRGKEVSIEGEPEDEYIAEKVIDALNFGFPFSTAMLIKEEENLFEILNIKEHTKKKDFERIRARIIGKNGKALSTISQLTKCHFELKDNEVGIIGPAECIKNGQEAIMAIVRGSKHANVYSYLEKHQVKPIQDFDLKEIK
jgi:ribosomal RNA assembly protein